MASLELQCAAEAEPALERPSRHSRIPLSTLVAVLGDQGKAGRLKKRIQDFDKDGDGTLDANEFRVALEQEYRSNRMVKLLWIVLTIALVALTGSVAATVGLTYWVVEATKEVKSDNHHGILVSASSGRPVQTGDMRSYVDLPFSLYTNVTSSPSGRRRAMLGGEAQLSVYCDDALGGCPVALSSCQQGRAWFDMLQSAKTVSDVIIEFSPTETIVLRARATAFTMPPSQPTISATVVPQDGSSTAADSYTVRCPDQLLTMPSGELEASSCVCPIYPTTGTTAQAYSSEGLSGSRRSLASLHSVMAAAAAVGGAGGGAAAVFPPLEQHSPGTLDSEVEPLLSLSCAHTYKAVAAASRNGRGEGHIFLPMPELGIPVSAKFTLSAVSASTECGSADGASNGGDGDDCSAPRPGTAETHVVLGLQAMGPLGVKLGRFEMVCPFLLPGVHVAHDLAAAVRDFGGFGGQGYGQYHASGANAAIKAGRASGGMSGAPAVDGGRESGATAAGGSRRRRRVLLSGAVEPSSLVLPPAGDQLAPSLAAWVSSASCHCHLYPLSEVNPAVAALAASLGLHRRRLQAAAADGTTDSNIAATYGNLTTNAGNVTAANATCKYTAACSPNRIAVDARQKQGQVTTESCHYEKYGDRYVCCVYLCECRQAPERFCAGVKYGDLPTNDGYMWGGTCFPAGTRVAVASSLPSPSTPAAAGVAALRRFYKAVEELQPGDLVLVADAAGSVSASPVEFFSHRDAASWAAYLELRTASGRTLTLSPGHFVYAASQPDWALRRAVPASHVRPGDYLFVLPPPPPPHSEQPQPQPAAGGHVAPSRVVAVQRVHKRGMYAFHTAQYGGRVLVEDVVASEFTTVLPPALARPGKWLLRQALLNPARLWGALPHSEALQRLLSDGPVADAGRALSAWVRQQLRSWQPLLAAAAQLVGGGAGSAALRPPLA